MARADVLKSAAMLEPGRLFTTRRRAPYAIRLSAALTLALFLTACGGGNDDATLAQIGTDEVLTEVRTFVDATRGTRANGSAPALPDRTVETRLWYSPQALAAPACRGGRCSAVVLAHGFGGRTSRFDAVARALASAGYIVAAPSFPRTNQDAPGGHLHGLDDLSEQPADVSFVLDELADTDAEPADPLYRRIDTAHSGAVGHSLGGATIVGATRTTCCGDARLIAAALVAPVPQLVEGTLGERWSATGPPTLVIGGSADPVVPPATLVEFYDAILPPRIQLEVTGANHVDLIENFNSEPDPHLALTVTALRAFFDTYLGGADGELEPALQALEAAGNPVRSDL